MFSDKPMSFALRVAQDSLSIGRRQLQKWDGGCWGKLQDSNVRRRPVADEDMFWLCLTWYSLSLQCVKASGSSKTQSMMRIICLPDVFLQVVPGDLGSCPDGVVELQIGQSAAQLSTASRSDMMCSWSGGCELEVLGGFEPGEVSLGKGTSYLPLLWKFAWHLNVVGVITKLTGHGVISLASEHLVCQIPNLKE